MMSNEANKALASRYFEEIWKGNPQVEAEVVAADVIVHAPPLGEALSLVYAASALRAAMPDVGVVENVVFGDGDRVVQRWTVAGTHNGADLYGVAAGGKKLALTGINIYRIVNGKIAERWGVMDSAGLMQQLQN
jgi:predicted ester cyclase